MEWDGHINSLATGIKCADKVTTVSETYMAQLKYQSAGLESLFENEQAKCLGILNGIDAELWDPNTDPMIQYHYNKETVLSGKKKTKKHFVPNII